MTRNDKENYRKLARHEWPGERAYNRLVMIAGAGNLEVDDTNPALKQFDDNCPRVSKLIDGN